MWKLLSFAIVALSVTISVLKMRVDKRIFDLEPQDKSEAEGNYTIEEFVDMMHILSEANFADDNGHNATMVKFNALDKTPDGILEIGFGLGQFSIYLAKKYPNSTVVGIDSHPLSFQTASNYLAGLPDAPPNVRFEYREDPRLREPSKSFDVITSTFVNHHIFPDEEFVDFLKHVARVGRRAFLFNDFHRSLKCIASNTILLGGQKYIGVHRLEPIRAYLPDQMQRVMNVLKPGRPGLELVDNSGMLSMLRSFSLSEYQIMFRQAGYPEGALQCTRLDAWYSIMPSTTCRVVCVADLTWAKDLH